MSYTVVLEPKAIQDIQEIIDHYEEEQPGLGEKFENALHQHLLTLQKSPFFQKRYENVRCLPLKKFPYMVHFTIDEKETLITVIAIFHTSLDPENWKRRK